MHLLGNQLTMQSGCINTTVSSESTCCVKYRLKPLQSHNKHVRNSLCWAAVPSGQETGCWWQSRGSVMADTFSAVRVQGKKGRDGMPGRMKECGITFLPHLERIAQSSKRRTPGSRALPGTFSLVLPCPAQPFHCKKSVTGMPYRTANKLCKQCHLVVPRPSACLVMNLGKEQTDWGLHYSHSRLPVCDWQS